MLYRCSQPKTSVLRPRRFSTAVILAEPASVQLLTKKKT